MGEKRSTGRRTAAARGNARTGRTRAAASRGSARRPPRRDERKVVVVGLHFGDTTTRVAASEEGALLRLKKDVFPNVVGFVRLKPSLTRGAGKAGVLYGDQATKFLQQVELRKPIVSGLVSDVRICRQFITHLCSAVDPNGRRRMWGVASIPALAGPEELEKAYRSLRGPLERVVVVPEPYLAAEGMRCEGSVQAERHGQDLTRGSLVVDVGRGTTDICLIRGGFPTAADQVRLAIAGNTIDDRIFTSALVHTPTLFLSRRMAREIKEEQAFVGGSFANSTRERSDLITFTEVIKSACDSLLKAIVEACVEILAGCGDDAGQIAQSIILTGGGSRIRNLPAGLETLLRAHGHPGARILVPTDHRTLISRGALRFAQKLGEEQWEALAGKTPAEIAMCFAADANPAALAGSDSALDALSALDVGLRDEASPLSGAPASAPPAPKSLPPAPSPKEREPEGIDIEELEFFKAR